MSATIVGLFDHRSEAEAVRQQLQGIGIPDEKIKLTAQAAETTTAEAAPAHKSFWQELKEWFGGEENERYASYYAEGTRRGGTLVTVEASDELADRAAEVLRQNGAVDIDKRAAEWGRSGWTGYTASASAPPATAPAAADTGRSTAIPVVKEELEVGKRKIEGGGVRVIRRVTAEPVTEDVNLRQERVDVQRRPVQRDLSGKDLEEAFTDKTIEVTETKEVPVTAKTARVVEEVVVNKDVEQRTEQVRDTVRRSDVQVERIPGKDAGETSSKTPEAPDASRPTKTPQP